MVRALYAIPFLAAAIAFGSCGEDESSKSQTAAQGQTAAQSPPARSAGEQSSGASGKQDSSSAAKERSEDARSQDRGSKADETRADGSGIRSGGSGKRSDTKSRPKRLSNEGGLLSEKQVYEYGRAGCRAFGPEHIKMEWKAKSLEPKDVAAAYSDAWATVAPLRTRGAMYRGCLVGLKERREQR